MVHDQPNLIYSTAPASRVKKRSRPYRRGLLVVVGLTCALQAQPMAARAGSNARQRDNFSLYSQRPAREHRTCRDTNSTVADIPYQALVVEWYLVAGSSKTPDFC